MEDHVCSASVASHVSLRKMRSTLPHLTDPMDWGMPGHLTKEEVDIFVSRHLSVPHLSWMGVSSGGGRISNRYSLAAN